MKSVSYFAGVVAFVCTTVLAMQTQAQTTPGVTGPELQDLLQKLGYRAQLTTDNQGDPKIQSAVGGKNFSIYFYNCNDAAVKKCTSIQFSSGYDLPNGIGLSVINKFNHDNRFTRAYVDDEMDPFLEMDVKVYSSLTQKSVEWFVAIWGILMGKFEETIGW